MNKTIILVFKQFHIFFAVNWTLWPEIKIQGFRAEYVQHMFQNVVRLSI